MSGMDPLLQSFLSCLLLLIFLLATHGAIVLRLAQETPLPHSGLADSLSPFLHCLKGLR